MKKAMVFAFPSINYTIKIYIDSVVKKITSENIKTQIEDGTINTIDKKGIPFVSLEYDNEE